MKKSIAILGFLLCAGSAAAENSVTTKHIKFDFASGRRCYNYEGTSNWFTGTFRKGDLVRVEMHALVPRTGWAKRYPDILDDGLNLLRFDADDETGILTAVIPRSGQYNISSSPEALAGRHGIVSICR